MSYSFTNYQLSTNAQYWFWQLKMFNFLSRCQFVSMFDKSLKIWSKVLSLDYIRIKIWENLDKFCFNFISHWHSSEFKVRNVGSNTFKWYLILSNALLRNLENRFFPEKNNCLSSTKMVPLKHMNIHPIKPHRLCKHTLGYAHCWCKTTF